MADRMRVTSLMQLKITAVGDGVQGLSAGGSRPDRPRVSEDRSVGERDHEGRPAVGDDLREHVEAHDAAGGEIGAAAHPLAGAGTGAGRAAARLIVGDRAAGDREGALVVVEDATTEGVAAVAADGSCTARGLVRGERAVA